MQTPLIILPHGDWQNVFTRSRVTCHIPKAVTIRSSAGTVWVQQWWLDSSLDYIFRSQLSFSINHLVFWWTEQTTMKITAPCRVSIILVIPIKMQYYLWLNLADGGGENRNTFLSLHFTFLPSCFLFYRPENSWVFYIFIPIMLSGPRKWS